MFLASDSAEKRRAACRHTLVLCCFAGLLLLLSTAAFAQAPAASHLSDFLNKISLTDFFPDADRLGPTGGNPPAAPVYKGDQLLGYIYLNSDVVDSTGYSGKPISIVIGIDLSGKIVGAKLVAHHEPIVLIGIPLAKVTHFIQGYVGLNFLQIPSVTKAGPPVDIVSGATVTSMVIGDSITRSSIRIAHSRGLGGASAALTSAAPATVKKIDQAKSATESWKDLLADGSVRRLRLTVGDINEDFAKSGNPLAAQHAEEGPDTDTFIDLYTALVTVPTIGRSLLGDARYQQLTQQLKPGQQAIIVAGDGRYSFKGSGYVRGGIFDRIEVVQGENSIRFRDRDQQRLGELHAEGAPALREISLFIVPAGANLDPAQAWRLRLLVQRAIGARDKVFLTFDLHYSTPDKFLIEEKPTVSLTSPQIRGASAVPGITRAEAAAPGIARAEANDNLQAPLWMRVWRGKVVEIAVVVVALLLLTAIFFFQDFLVRRPVLYDRVRIAYLIFTLIWLGWYAGAQLSVVNVLTFFNALRTNFRWDYFLIDPLIFILWCAVAAGMLFWGRGAFCGWLCPFGALQELLNRAAKLIRVPQIHVPFALHQRLWPIKYIAFLVLFGLSLYQLSTGEEASEIEPFKTTITLHFIREWPFVLYAVVLLFIGLFVERAFCRYLCPLGAALAIPARLRMFEWLWRYRECGNPCQRCANECPVQSIHPDGRINPNECIQCLHCQMLYHHAYKCPVMIQKRLKIEKRLALTSPSMRPPMKGSQTSPQ